MSSLEADSSVKWMDFVLCRIIPHQERQLAPGKEEEGRNSLAVRYRVSHSAAESQPMATWRLFKPLL